eukprot:gene18447-biopygen8278
MILHGVRSWPVRNLAPRSRRGTPLIPPDASAVGASADSSHAVISASDAQASVKLLGSAGRADVVAAPTGGARSKAKVVTGSLAAPAARRPAPHQHLQDSVESSLASGAASRRTVKAMPGPLALKMSAAYFGHREAQATSPHAVD